jgi:ABC-type uncharacterized transport system permease subunit
MSDREPDQSEIPVGEPSDGDQDRQGPAGRYDWLTGVGTRAGRALLIPSLALLSALIVGAVIIAVTDLDALREFGDNPGRALADMAESIGDSYVALAEGSVGSVQAISETLFAATPLIMAGLAVAVGFRAGLFNIGANGQIHAGGMVSLWIGISFSMPAIFHIPLAVFGGIIGGAAYGAIAGLLKAKTGAHEVITTIMLNFVAIHMVTYLLKTSPFQKPGANNPISEAVADSAQFPGLLGGSYRLHIGFLIAVGLVVFANWLLFRSTIGYEFRAVGHNPDAAKYAGMSVVWVYVGVMAVSGGLAGIAGANHILGLAPYEAQANFAGQVGFDAIALALLGRSHPTGVLWAGLLFGALRAGGRQMQGAAGIPIDLVVVMQALIIVFIAAPALVRAIYRVKGEADETTAVSTGWGA